MSFKEIFEVFRSFVQMCGSIIWLAISIKIIFIIWNVADKLRGWKP